MSSQPDSQLPPQAPQMAGKTGIGRRRLLRAGLAAAPVALAVSGRSAMASPSLTGCPKGLSPMAWASVSPNGTGCNLMSHTVGQNTLGSKPMVWTPNPMGTALFNIIPKPWPSPVVPFDPSLFQVADIPRDSSTGAILPTFWDSGTRFNQIFQLSSSSKSFSRILLEHPGTTDARLCAAYLNALFDPTYALTPTEVVNIEKNPFSIRELDAFLEQTW